MSGQIFISYRREDSSASAGRLYDRLSARLPKNQIFIDVDLDPGIDFVEAIETSVGSCDVLIAVIGKEWLLSSDEGGKRRLENPEDFVRVEIATALKRNIRVIPVLVDGVSMPRSSDLPDDLKLLVRRNAVDVSHSRFNADLGRLLAALERVLEKANAERKQREEKERLEAERLQLEERERFAHRDRAPVLLETTPTPTPTTEGDARAAFDRGRQAGEKQKYDQSINDLTEAIRLKPDFHSAYFFRGFSYFFKGQYDKAISDLNEAIRLEPNEGGYYVIRAGAYHAQGKLDKFQADYAKAYELNELKKSGK